GRLEQVLITSRDPGEPPAAYLASSGGIFRDMTIHDLDMARFFVPDIVEVTARGANTFSATARELGDFDSAVVTLRGANDELVNITNSRHAAYGYDQRFEVFGSEGLLQVGNQTDTRVRHWG
ncbi:inositol 2-dehydrogenase, partial [Bacillus sp. S34]|nr:inositol 2-dehydrogenase [Bacillus sp. S34]